MYIGVKYIGGNESKEDTICNSGAIWKKNEVFNFEEESAKKLAVHTDSFVLVDMSPKVKTYANKAANAVDNYEPFPSLAGMSVEEIATLASVRYGIKIETEGREKDDVVFDALNRIKAASLRADATELGVKVLPVVSMTVTDEEYKAYIEGKLELSLTPAAKSIALVVTDEDLQPILGTDLQSSYDPKPLFFGEEANPVVLTPVIKPAVEEVKDAKEADLPTLSELLASLSTKKELQAFAKEQGITYANSMNEMQLRAKLIRELRI